MKIIAFQLNLCNTGQCFPVSRTVNLNRTSLRELQAKIVNIDAEILLQSLQYVNVRNVLKPITFNYF